MGYSIKAKTLEKRYGKTNAKLLKILKFLVLFNIFAVPLYIFMAFGVSIYPLQIFTSKVVYSSLYMLGLSPQINGLEIMVPTPDGNFTGSIDWDCTGWKSILAFLALVFATDEILGKKLYSLAFIPIIYAFNIFRVVFVFLFVFSNGLANYEFVHSFFFGYFMIIAILCLWVIWLKYFKIPEINNKKKR